ncbi:MAG: hypothetical protein KDC38_21170, partial [Planctomycetes bacterium]|nr:hypothetical protein [Planctomycetota bacterium]
RITWTPGADQSGFRDVEVVATDGDGHTSPPHSFTIDVEEVIDVSPVFTSTPDDRARAGEPYQYAALVDDADGDPIDFSLDVAPGGMAIDSVSGVVTWSPTAGDVGGHTVVIRADDRRGGIATQDYALWVVLRRPDIDAPVVTLTGPAQISVGVGAVFAVTSIDDTAVVATELVVAGPPEISIPLDASGGGTHIFATTGVATLVARAADAAGHVGSATIPVIVVDPAAATPVTVDIASPLDDASIDDATEVVVTVDGPDLAWHRLELVEHGEMEPVLVTSGSAPLIAQAAATIDPTTLANGIYTLRLSAWNLAGQSFTTERVVSIDTAGRKPGAFRFALLDADVSLGTVPIRIVRSYDSTDRSPGDFGIGWRLALGGPKLVENRRVADHWLQAVTGTGTGGAPLYGIIPTRPHTATVYLSPDEFHRFEASVQPEDDPFLIVGLDGIDWSAQPGSLGSLAPSTQPSLIDPPGQTGPVALRDADSSVYDPAVYTYTTVTGIALEFTEIEPASLVHRLSRITDRSGNSIDIGPTGIVASTGPSVL